MGPLELFFYVALPLTVGAAGVIYGELFRMRVVSKVNQSTEEEILKGTVARLEEAFLFAARSTLPRPIISSGRGLDWKDVVYLRLGTTPLATLRRTYGSNFAAGYPDYFTLGDILRQLDPETLELIKRDYASGRLDEIAHA